MIAATVRSVRPLRCQWIHVDDWIEVLPEDIDARDTEMASMWLEANEEDGFDQAWVCAAVREYRRQQGRHDLADAAWARDPQAAMRKYGLPCWHGHYGGCEDCDRV